MKKKKVFLVCCAVFSVAAVFLHEGTSPAALAPELTALAVKPDGLALEQFLEEVYQDALDAGAVNFTPYSLLLIKHANDALQNGQSERAALLSKYALLLSPDLPVAHSADAWMQWNNDKLKVLELLKGVYHAFLQQYRHIDTLFFNLHVNLLVAGGAFMLVLVVVVIVFMMKYLVLFLHDVFHVVPAGIPRAVVWSGVAVLFFAPLFLKLSVVWMLLYWLLILSGYSSRHERLAVITLVACFAVVVPLLTFALAGALSAPCSTSTSALWQVQYDYCGDRCMDTMEETAFKHPDDPEVLLSMGLANKKEKNFKTALKYYERLLYEKPSDYRALTGAGNVYLATERWDKAVAMYKDAITAAPDRSAAAHFNYARAYQQKFMFQESERELAAAKAIDHSRVDRYLSIYSENYNRLLMDEPLPRVNLFLRAAGYPDSIRREAESIWNLFFHGLPMVPGLAVLVAVLIVNAVLAGQERFRVATRCSVCGKVLCKRCQAMISSDVLCTQCQNFIQKQEKLSYKVKKLKINQIQTFIRFYSTAATVFGRVFPGAGHVWKEKPVKGMIILFFYFVLALKTVFVFMIDGPWDFVFSAAAVEETVFVILLALYWLLIFRDFRSVRSKAVEDNIALKSITVSQ